MRLIINGYAQHGKDTVGDLFVALGLRKVNMSHYIAFEIMQETELGPYHSIMECYEDRVNNRAEWYNFIRSKCTPDPAHYVKIAFESGDIYCGHRNREEFETSKQLADATIWVDASRRGMPKESPKSCDLTYEGHDFILDNGGSIVETVQQVAAIYKLVENKKRIPHAYPFMPLTDYAETRPER